MRVGGGQVRVGAVARVGQHGADRLDMPGCGQRLRGGGEPGVQQPLPGLDFGYRILRRVLPLGWAPVIERGGELDVGG